MNGWTLARRTASRYKTRTVLAVVGVAVIGALNFDMILLSRGLLVSFGQLLDEMGFDVRVTSGIGVPVPRQPIPGAESLAGQLQRLPEVEQVAVLWFDSGSAEANGTTRSVTLVGAGGSAPNGGWTIVAGHSLDPHASGAAPAVLVSRAAAEELGVSPGSRLRVRSGAAGDATVVPGIDCLVAGVADFMFQSSGELTIATSAAGFDALHGGAHGDADLVLVRSAPEAGADAAARAIVQLRPDLHAYSNADLVELFNRNNFAYFRQISAVLSTTTALFTALLVATLLTVAVNHRLGEIAALRAIGISRRRIVSMLLWESGLLVGAGGLLALPLGGAFAVLLDGILRRMPSLPERLHFFVFEPRALVLHAALLLVTGLLAAAYPIRVAVAMPIAETLRREVIS
jgi:putative ABC transport system permease protein